jgi:hypothetical protein
MNAAKNFCMKYFCVENFRHECSEILRLYKKNYAVGYYAEK